MNAPTAIELSSADRMALAHASDAVAAHQLPGDTEGWVLEAQLHSACLSWPLRRTLLRFRRFGDPAGGLVVRGTTHEPAAPTPSDPATPEPAVTPCAAAMSVLLGELGEQYAFRGELGGRLFQNIVPVRGYETEQISIGSAVDLAMHTEMAFSDLRSDFVALLCLREDPDGVALTSISSIDAMLPLLDAEVLAVLSEPRFRTRVDPSFRLASPEPVTLWVDPIRVVGGPQQRPHLRVDFAETEGKDPEARDALSALRAAAARTLRTVKLCAGDLLIVDNHRALHGRTPFVARYDGSDRWLLRSFVTKDLSPSEISRRADQRIVETPYDASGAAAGSGGN